MKIEMSVVLKNYKGEPIKNLKEELTLKEACCDAIMNIIPGDEKMKWEAKHKLGVLGREIWEGKDSFSSEEITLMKERMGSRFSQMVVEPAILLLEGEKDAKVNNR